MAAVCAAFASRQLSRSAAAGLFPTIIRRTFASSTSQYNNASADTSVRDTLRATTPNAHRNLAAKRGSLASGSIFDDDFDIPQFTTDGPTPRRKKPAEGESPENPDVQYVPLEERDRNMMAPVLSPNAKRTALWQRKMVIRDIRRRGRLTNAEQVMRTERESLSKSHWFKTSVKKLGPLARQIAGKNIDDAILQMRFSKKKAAKDVKEFLEQAKNEAVVIRGMGIPKAEGEDQGNSPITITLKDKKKLTINDPSSIYISQAWVNRGPYGRDFDHRARGNINILRPPYTGISVVLKEEKTRIREWQEREQREAKRRETKPWVQLPDRKVTAQNQYYSW